ncbi:MAG TPA: cell division ATP-binding protein FtsE [Nitrospiria bacterium]|nr:cell division ATP-binding protein FtsE [Nitrospiria bacterium]
MIQLFHVYKSYGRHRVALEDITLRIEKGEFAWLTGPSGAGKSTLLKLLFGLEQPDSGQIVIQNRNVARVKASGLPLLRRSIGFIFQDFKLLQKKTVFDNVAVALQVAGASPAEIRRRVSEVLGSVGLEHKKDLMPTMLSAGEQQRVCVARSIVNHPMILLADEPTGNLDAELTAEIFELLKTINAKGTTMLVATHNREVVSRIRRRVIGLKEGRVVEGGA